MSRLARRAAERLAELDARGERRRIEPPRGVDFASNDYLGLRADPRVIAAARAVLEEQGGGAGAARLLRGDHPAHRALEREFAAWHGAEDALLFASGFAANVGVLQTLGEAGWRIVSDAHNHASIIEGCRAAKADVVVVAHNDPAAFARAVEGERTLVVTETVFSMHGDRAPVGDLVALCRARGAALICDEAHAIGLFEPTREADLRVNPCGKALAASGAVVTGPRDVIELLRSRCRTFLFSTAPPPPLAAAALAALRIARAEPQRGERALELARRVSPDARSWIVPVWCRDNAQAVAAQEALAERGLDVRCVRPPTVPRAALRLSFHSDRTDDEVARLKDALAELELAP